MIDLGSRPAGVAIGFDFNTTVNGILTDLAGTPAISIYKNGNTTEVTTGLTLTAPYDSRTGFNHVDIVTTNVFYAPDVDYTVIISTGTLGGVSVVGMKLASFTLTTRETNIDKTAKAIARGTVTSGSSTTSVTTSALTIAGAAASGVVADQFKNRTILFDGDTTTAGLRGASATISANTASNTPTLTVGTLPATPASGDLFSII